MNIGARAGSQAFGPPADQKQGENSDFTGRASATKFTAPGSPGAKNPHK